MFGNNEKPIVKFGGGTSSIELYKDYLIIKPSLSQKISGSTKTIPFDSVVSVNIVTKMLMTPYLQVMTPGMIADKKNDIKKGSDANVVLIQPGNMKKAKEIQEYIMKYKMKSPEQTAMPTPVGIDLDSLEQLDELRKKGIITQEEFDAKKKQILGI